MVGLVMGRVDGEEAAASGPGGVEVEGASGSNAILLHFLFLHKKMFTLEIIRRLFNFSKCTYAIVNINEIHNMS